MNDYSISCNYRARSLRFSFFWCHLQSAGVTTFHHNERTFHRHNLRIRMTAKGAPTDSYNHWLGRSTTADDVVALNSARQMAALLDRDPSCIHVGSEIPPHWYQILFSPHDLQSELADDGHPRKGGFLPPIALPQRMFAGRRVAFNGPLIVGDHLTRISTVCRIAPKAGRDGELVFVTVRHVIRNSSEIEIAVEEQDVVYKHPSRKTTTRDEKLEKLENSSTKPAVVFREQFEPDETMLFRYSAITFNAHRIHYDLAYASRVESYPALVVNGGLTTLKIWEAVLRKSPGRITSSHSRNLRPLFVGCPVEIFFTFLDDQSALAWAVDSKGAKTTEMTLKFASNPGSTK